MHIHIYNFPALHTFTHTHTHTNAHTATYVDSGGTFAYRIYMHACVCVRTVVSGISTFAYTCMHVYVYVPLLSGISMRFLS